MDPYGTESMCRLNWIHAGSIANLEVFSCSGSNIYRDFSLGHVLNEPLNVKTDTQHGSWSHQCRLQQDQNCLFKASESIHRVWKWIIHILMRLRGCTDTTWSFWTKSQIVGFLVQWLKYFTRCFGHMISEKWATEGKTYKQHGSGTSVQTATGPKLFV